MYLYGASGHAKVIIDILKAEGITVDALIDDDPNVKELIGYSVLHNSLKLSPMIVSIGINATRKKVVERLQCEFGKAIHPSAIISDSVTIGEGTVVMHGAIIQPCAVIGKHSIINTGASVDHDCVIGDYTHIAPRSTLCGNVQVGEGTWIGAGSVVIPGVKIGKWSIVGAGAVVVGDIPDYCTAVGVPARVIKRKLIHKL